MSNYVKSKKEMMFPSLDSLKSVNKVIDEANAAMNDKSRTIAKSAIPEVLAGALGVGVGGAASFAALFFGGSVVGGGMAAGVAVLAAPAVVLGAAGVGIASSIKNKKLKDAKETCYKNAVKAQSEIIEALREEAKADKERLDYLNALNTLLQSAIKDLKHDLGMV